MRRAARIERLRKAVEAVSALALATDTGAVRDNAEAIVQEHTVGWKPKRVSELRRALRMRGLMRDPRTSLVDMTP